MKHIQVYGPMLLGAYIQDVLNIEESRERFPTLFATDSNPFSIDSAPAHGATTLGCCITRALYDYDYAEMARLAYYAMRNNLRLMSFPNTIISIPEHIHTESVTIGD